MVMIRVYQYAALCCATYYALLWYKDQKQFVSEYAWKKDEHRRHVYELRKAKRELKREQREQGIIDPEEVEREELWKIRLGDIRS